MWLRVVIDEKQLENIVCLFHDEPVFLSLINEKASTCVLTKSILKSSRYVNLPEIRGFVIFH